MSCLALRSFKLFIGVRIELFSFEKMSIELFSFEKMSIELFSFEGISIDV